MQYILDEAEYASMVREIDDSKVHELKARIKELEADLEVFTTKVDARKGMFSPTDPYGSSVVLNYYSDDVVSVLKKYEEERKNKRSKNV